ncbi:MAG: ribose-phosphate diphosphokinase [Phycisphaerae bacterium]
MTPEDPVHLKVFAGRSNRQLTQDICDYLQIPVGDGFTDMFADGELIVRVKEDVRGRDCFIIQPTSFPPNAYLMELMIWIDTLRRASAKRVTAVIPYFGYARQDRKDEGRVPITAKLVANLIERAGADRVVAVDLHAAQVQGFFDIPVDHLAATPVICEWFMGLGVENRVFVSPDVGNVKRAQAFASKVGGEICIIDKRRMDGMKTEAHHVIGEVAGRNVFITDDMISTAGTVCEACRILKQHGAKDIYIAATHGVFSGPALDRLAEAPFTKLAVTDTIDLAEVRRDPRIKDRLSVLSVNKLIGEAISRIHRNQSVSALFKNDRGRSLAD